ncbi:general odorant-binding protein 56d-like [Atheta coriaria]|uniref:general odorant-binding protein 56d-like n=1 Tax=Dalotia coriaria TaxID=877792 RepID=UPI0031F34A88
MLKLSCKKLCNKMADYNLIKYIAVLCVLFVMNTNAWKNVPQEYVESGNVIMATCLGKIPISKETVEKARDFIFPEHGTEEEGHYKCYLKCVFEEMGVWENGGVNADTATKAFPENLREKFRSNHVTCQDTRGADECDSAYQIMECYKNNDPNIFFVI